MEKTVITHLSDQRVRFLGYEIAKTRENTAITQDTLGRKKRTANETIQLLVPAEVIRKKLEPFVANGKAVHHSARINLPLQLESRFTVVQQVENGLEPLEATDGVGSQPELDMAKALARVATECLGDLLR
jgi:hypothetical protein